MSRYIRTGGSSGSGIDLSTCAINTNQTITTSSGFCGSGKCLCNTSFDLICSYKPTTSGCFGTGIQFDLPTHCHHEFLLRVANICSVCSIGCILLGNSTTRCLSSNCTSYCCLSFNYAANTYSFYECVNPSTSVMCIPAYPDVSGTGSPAPGKISFDFYLQKIRQNCGICFSYCNNAYNCCCALHKYRQGAIHGDACACIAWNAACACSCRFTHVYFCNGCGLCYIGNDFCYLLYGLKCTV